MPGFTLGKLIRPHASLSGMSQVLTVRLSHKQPSAPSLHQFAAFGGKLMERWGFGEHGDLTTKLVHLRVKLVGVRKKMSGTTSSNPPKARG